MTDETLIAQVKAIGKQFMELEDIARERGYDVRIFRPYSTTPRMKPSIEVWKKV